jgi:hypothetical protein
MPNPTHFGPNLHRWNGDGQIPHAHQVVGRAGEGETPVHFADSATNPIGQLADGLYKSLG